MDEGEKRAIAWRCRRGMLELDKRLLAFWEGYAVHADGEVQVLFRELLQHTDMELQQWLGGDGLPADEQLQALVQLIRGFRLWRT